MTVRVAVIDSGIAVPHPHIGAVVAGRSFVGIADDTADRIGHGTAVAAAICEKAPSVELLPVRVFDRALATDAQTLAAAIRWAADAGCVLLNLSLGTANSAHETLLMESVAYARERGAWVVSAAESDGVRWYPGAWSAPRGANGVIGVLSLPLEESGDRDVLRVVQSAGACWYAASIFARPIPGVPSERNLRGVSFAVANVTGLLARALTAGRSVEAILAEAS